jgi:hypothetical protein
MKNEKDPKYKSLKIDLSEKIYEITNIWNCGVKKRQIAHQNHIYSWNDIKCNSNNMNFNETPIAHIIDGILDINRQDKDIIRPKKIKYDRNKWIRAPKKTLEFYLDFETFNSNFGSISNKAVDCSFSDNKISYDNNQYIFMIGIGYIKNKKWIFKTFIMNRKTALDEKKMFNQFNVYINKMLRLHKKDKARFYHWSNAEPIIYKNFKLRHPDLKYKDNNYSFYDLNKIFTKEPVFIHGAFNFSLKNIGRALYNHKLINSNWDSDSMCSNGLSALILANNLYETIDLKDNILDQPIMKDIIFYNEIDCKVMYEIHSYIKKNL